MLRVVLGYALDRMVRIMTRPCGPCCDILLHWLVLDTLQASVDLPEYEAALLAGACIRTMLANNEIVEAGAWIITQDEVFFRVETLN